MVRCFHVQGTQGSWMVEPSLLGACQHQMSAAFSAWHTTRAESSRMEGEVAS